LLKKESRIRRNVKKKRGGSLQKKKANGRKGQKRSGKKLNRGGVRSLGTREGGNRKAESGPRKKATEKGIKKSVSEVRGGGKGRRHSKRVGKRTQNGPQCLLMGGGEETENRSTNEYKRGDGSPGKLTSGTGQKAPGSGGNSEAWLTNER